MKFRKVIFTGVISLFLLGLIFFYQNAQFSDGKLHIIFCDVGQGDGIFIRTPKGMDIIIDGGPDDKILSCLSNHMPFWDRTIELMFLSHPHLDHFMGLISVLERYSVLEFSTEKLSNSTASFRQLLGEVQEEKLQPRFLYIGDRFTTKDGVSIAVLGPSKEFIKATSPTGDIAQSGEFASLILLVSYKGFDAILTGDSQAKGISSALASQGVALRSYGIEVLQVPHHGSKTGLSSEILDTINPRLAVISVGKKNRYGHPRKEILEMLKNGNIKILRTDHDGEIEIVSDGERWGVKK
ncbi:MAG: hypothetical protein Q7S38_00270 [bacterium]|nr:hypothetical protein [bacterium]